MPKMDIINKIGEEPYKSILSMIIAFREEGLKPMHLRYELGKKTKDENGNVYRAKLKIRNEKGFETSIARSIEKFLKNKRHLYCNDIIVNNDRIGHPKQLSEKLALLESNNVIAYSEKNRYKIRDCFFGEIIRKKNHNSLCEYSPDQIEEVKLEHPEDLGCHYLRNTTYGCPEPSSSEEEKLYIDAIKKINDGYIDLINFKVHKINKTWKVKLQKFKEKTKSVQIKDIIDADISKIDDDYFGDTFLLFCEAISINKDKESTKELFSNAVHDQIKGSETGLEPSDITNIIDFGWNNIEFLNSMYPLKIVICLYYSSRGDDLNNYLKKFAGKPRILDEK